MYIGKSLYNIVFSPRIAGGCLTIKSDRLEIQIKKKKMFSNKVKSVRL